MANLDMVVVLSGASGSGKSTAAHVLEDLGFFCIDNVPVSLIDTVISLCEQNEEVERVALVIDAREGSFLENVGSSLDRLLNEYPTSILWLDAQDKVLLNRFQITRRRHPLGTELRSALKEERELLTEVASRATASIDTSHMSPTDLTRAIRDAVMPETKSEFRLSLCSFGFRHGIPPDADQIIDVRFLPNPYWDEDLRPYSGRDAPIQAFMEQNPKVEEFLDVLVPFLCKSVELGRDAGKVHMSIAIGCTGGQHRSVYITEKIAQNMENLEITIRLNHRNLQEANS